MSTVATGRCTRCAHAVGVDDHFCEQCGAALGGATITSVLDWSAKNLGRVAAVTDRGLVHITNEDAYYVAVDGDASVAVVCDGVSSSTAGGIAARVAADVAGRALRGALGTARDDCSKPAMLAAFAAALIAVSELAWSPARNGTAPSTTMVAATSMGGVVTVAGVGDSRAYWIDDVEARLLTRDDSWVEDQVAKGLLPAERALEDPRAHMITAWLGADAPELAPRVIAFRPRRHGWLLLCSDGLWNSWPDPDDLAALVRDAGTDGAIDLAEALTDLAIAEGGRDNITVVVAEIGANP